MCATYLLQIEAGRNFKTRVGKLGSLYFKKGYYLYVGSAKRGLEARIKRHLRKDKKIFWHIDYLKVSPLSSEETLRRRGKI